jgi:predicted phage terminase large subunit-like protein
VAEGDGGRITPQQAAAILLQRRQCRESLLRYAETIVIPGAPAGEVADDAVDAVFLPAGSGLADHHRVLCTELQRCITTRYGRLMVFMPPGSAKSTYCSVVAPTWAMGREPGTQIILAMHNTEIAKKQGRKARSIIKQDVYQGTFGTGLSKETAAAEMWAVGNGSEYMGAGILSGIAGNRARGMVIDDPIRGRKDADSPAIRKSTLEAYEDDLITRLIPGGWIVLVQTRWHQSDLAGSLLPENYAGESGDILCRDGLVWRVLNLPAEAVHEDDPLGRKPGEMLWPEWFDEQHWRPFRKNARTWAALCQQNPVPDSGGEFERDWFKWYEPHEKPPWLNKFVASDYAVTEEGEGLDPDFTEHGCCGVDNEGGLWLLDWWFSRATSDVSVDALLNMAKRNHVRMGFGEVGVIRRAIEPIFKRAQRDKKWPLKIVYMPHIGDKRAKVQSFRGLAAAGKVHLPRGAPWAERLVDQLCGFPAVAHDDGVDVCALFGRAVDEMAYARIPQEEEIDEGVKPFSWRWLCMGTENGDKPDKPRVM